MGGTLVTMRSAVLATLIFVIFCVSSKALLLSISSPFGGSSNFDFRGEVADSMSGCAEARRHSA